MDEQITDRAIKGRGAVGNPSGRFEPYTRARTDDGWWLDPQDLEQRPATRVLPDSSRSILARNDSPDVPFDRSINPYRGCEHGCPYCFARPSHAYLGLSPGIDFETKLFYKADAAQLLRQELARRSYVPAPIMFGANTDPYQPLERRLGVTRSLLEVLHAQRHPAYVLTKAALILRDADLLADMAAHRLVRVLVTLTTRDMQL